MPTMNRRGAAALLILTTDAWFAGDVHVQLHLAALLEAPRGALGPIARTLGRADRGPGVFAQLCDARWPIWQMRLTSDFGGDDDRSMAADNTSALNCRRVAGSDRWSDHAYGVAIDINRSGTRTW